MQGLTSDQAISLASNLNFKGPLLTEAAKQIEKLYSLFIDVDATQIEINPFGETPDGRGQYDYHLNFIQ